MKQIPLTQGHVALVDDEDYEKLSKFKWCAQKGVNTFYAIRDTGPRNARVRVRMHQQIMGDPPEPGMEGPGAAQPDRPRRAG